MKKTIAAAAVAASIAAGGLGGAVLGSPAIAGAAETAGGWVQDALGGLVDDGTITQAQADAVETALEEARPARGPHGFHADLGVLTEALGVTEDELRTSLRDGDTIAEVAAAEGVDVQVVIDAIVAAQQERVDAKVAEGDLTQEEADERMADAEERATDLVNGELPLRGPGHRGGRR